MMYNGDSRSENSYCEASGKSQKYITGSWHWGEHRLSKPGDGEREVQSG